MDLKELIEKDTPDLLLLDWQDESALDCLDAASIPIALLRPQTVQRLESQSSKNYKEWILEAIMSSCRSRFYTNHLESAEDTPVEPIAAPNTLYQEASVASATIPTAVPGCITFLKLPNDPNYSQETAPSMELIGPLLANTYPSLTNELTEFLDAHDRVLYVTLGAHAKISAFKINDLVNGIKDALEQEHINGVIWATQSLDLARSFFDIFEDLLNNEDPQWRFLQ